MWGSLSWLMLFVICLSWSRATSELFYATKQQFFDAQKDFKEFRQAETKFAENQFDNI